MKSPGLPATCHSNENLNWPPRHHRCYNKPINRGDIQAASQRPTIAQQQRVLEEHFQLSIGLHGERRGSIMMRKFGIKFSVHHPLAATVKNAFIGVKSLHDWQQVLEQYYVHDQSYQTNEQIVSTRPQVGWVSAM